MQLSHFLLKRFGVCLVLFLLCSVAAFASDPNLVAYWQLDGDFLDSSPGLHHGTFHDDNASGAQWAGGVDGQAIDLDGVDDYVETPYILNPATAGPFSAVAWVKGGAATQKIICQTDVNGIGRIWLHVAADGVLYTNLTEANNFSLLNAGFPWDSDNWHHVGVTWDGFRRRLYMDGQVVAADTEDISGLEYTEGVLYIGAHKTLATGQFWNGLIDDVRIYNRALSEAEIADMVGPILSVSDTDFMFVALEAGANPNDQLLTVSNPGGGTVNWSIVDVNEVTLTLPGWLTIAPANGVLGYDESEPVTLSADITGLSGGQYSYAFDVVAPGAVNSPQTVTVELDVIGPILSVSSNTFSFIAPESGANPDDQTLTISNPGGGTVNWSIVDVNEVTLTLPDWLTIAPANGSLGYDESEPVTLSVDITGLPVGQYSFAFQVVDPAAANSPQMLTVDLKVIGPILSVSETDFNFVGLEAGANPDSQVLTVENLGGGTVNWSIDTTDKPGWLILMPTSGSLGPNESEPVTLSIDTTGLVDGLYSYAFQMTAPGAANSLQTIAVYLGIGRIIDVPGTYPTIQAAINASASGDTIIVSPGTYYENVVFDSNYVNDIILTSVDPSDPVVVASTIIDGGNDGSVVTFSGGETSDLQLRGFTITNGYATGPYPSDSGGGIMGNGTLATISSCNITGNRALYVGGGLCDCDGAVMNCAISNNTIIYSKGAGGGLYGCDGSITNCTIVGNTAGWYGGGLYGCDGSITNCTILFNISPGLGGGLAYCDGIITNCTILGNETDLDGGGLYDCDGSIVNCIIWNNNAGRSGDQLIRCSHPSYSCVQGGTGGGTGNITANPLFADADSGDYHLKSEYGRWDPNEWVTDTVTSPCIDAGAPSDVIPGDPNDWQNELWPNGGRINMGAYGGTAEASMSGNPIGNVADLDHDDHVTLHDFALFSRDWQTVEYLLDTDFDLNGVVDIDDLAEFAYQWLWEPGPILEVSETVFWPVGYEGGFNPDPNILTVFNTGVRMLNWSIDTTGKPEWLTIAPTSGSLGHDESEPVTLSVDVTGLAVGQYSYAFDVVDPAAMNSPQTVTVELEVIGPIIGVSETSFSYVVYESGTNPDPNVLTISNPGGGTVNWSIDTTGKPDWLNVTPTSGTLGQGQSEPVTLSVDITGLSVGQYSYAFDVMAPGAVNNPQTVTVGLEVVGLGPILSVLEVDFNFVGLEAGANPDSQVLAVENLGGGTVNWSIDTTGKPDWLNVMPTSGTLGQGQSEPVTLSVDITGLSGGQYSYSFDVVDPGAVNSPQTVTVQLAIGTQGDFESGWGIWTNVTGVDTDEWFRDSGGTPSGSTGPASGAGGSTWYAYMETSDGYAYTAGDTAILEGPNIGGSNRVLSFYYHMYGSTMGMLNVDVYSGGAWTNGVWSISGQQHTSSTAPYTEAVVDLSSFTGTIKVRFRGVAAGDFLGDMAIDNISIYEE